MSVTLLRHGKLQSVTVKAAGSLDAQGIPTYGASQVIAGRVVRKNEEIRLPTGESVKVAVTAWFAGSASPLPVLNDQLTFADGLVGIVVERHDNRTLQDALDHVRVRCREE